MKTFVLFVGLICALCLFSIAKAGPVDELAMDVEDGKPLVAPLAAENPESLMRLNRQKRFTCDVLESTEACIFHCLLLGRRGGYCSSKKICICRM